MTSLDDLPEWNVRGRWRLHMLRRRGRYYSSFLQVMHGVHLRLLRSELLNGLHNLINLFLSKKYPFFVAGVEVGVEVVLYLFSSFLEFILTPNPLFSLWTSLESSTYLVLA